MKHTLLSKYFIGIVAKRLSDVEVDPKVSNQHEFNGVSDFKRILGTQRASYEGTFIYICDDEEDNITENGCLTWYDARENHPIRSEFRLYYSPNSIVDKAKAGDSLFIGITHDKRLAVIVAMQGTTSEQQLLWLFELGNIGNRFVFRDISVNDSKLLFAGNYILESLGFEAFSSSPKFLEQIIEKFGETFPTTSIFSEFARSTLSDISPLDDADTAILSWLEREELLFKTLEKHILEKKLQAGFGRNGTDVEEFLAFSLSVQQRRKSRAGHAFENHLAHIFKAHSLQFSKGSKTERNNKPDFLFPSVDYYHSEFVNIELLTMLGVKTTAKDRWRQVLSEADKISQKHLITLEPAISVNQTDEMRAQNLHLVIPASLHSSYTYSQQPHLLSLNEFIELVNDRQKRIYG